VSQPFEMGGVKEALGGCSGRNIAIFGASTAIMSLQPLVLHLANERSTEDEKMSADGFMLAAEVMKITLCGVAALGRRAMGLECRAWCGMRHTLAFAFPAAIYLVMNHEGHGSQGHCATGLPALSLHQDPRNGCGILGFAE